MASARIITDSSCELAADVIEPLGITVLPWRVRVGAEILVDTPGLRTPEWYQSLLDKKLTPSVVPPSAQDYVQAFERLTRETDQIIVVTPGTKLARCLTLANQARQAFLGRSTIHVLDSTFIGRAMGMLVEETARLARQGETTTDIIREVSGLIPRSYLAIYTDSLATMAQRGLVDDRDEEVRGTASYRPLLLVEDGQIVPLPRSRKRGAPAERIVEFVAEFSKLSQLYLIHNGHAPLMNELRTALGEALPKQTYTEHIFGPVFAALIGLRAFAVAALEA
ncbi:MAG: DegV family protein [Anaerolineales bacterium]